jgi:DNA ligase-1
MLRPFAFTVLALYAVAAPADEPPVALAEVYHLGEDIDLAAYRVSEKYDGIRAWWDGHRLITRGGQAISTPAWFVEHWPRVALDGELWAGRGHFEDASGIARRLSADDAQWRQLRYMVFDMPQQPGTFEQRLQALTATIRAIDRPNIQLVEQALIGSVDELHQRLDTVVAGGGEGLVLHRRDSLYTAGRSRDLLKLKPYDDAEARVVAYQPGKGKYEGMVGSLLVERADGLRFGLGSGLSDEQRRHPPAIGSTVTYAYTGTTEAGVPRFARFLRVRNDSP